MYRRDVIWHRIIDPRHRYLRDYGLSCGHTLSNRKLVRGKDASCHVPKFLSCPHCARGAAPSLTPFFPPNAMRTAAGWAYSKRLSAYADAQRCASVPPLVAIAPLIPLPPASPESDHTIPSRRISHRITASWSPRDLAARNND